MSQKSFKITFLEKTLKFMAKSVLWRHNKTKIIGITGSVGKTTTKDMVVCVLKAQKNIYFTKKNYNNEIGVPLTILGINKNVTSPLSMIGVCGKWLKNMVSPAYPEILVIEMGVDRPGDMDYLTSIVNPDISILTSVSYAHSEFFDSIEQIAQEKQKIIMNMKQNGQAIINYDDKNVRSVINKINKKFISYGTHKNADFIATDIDICFHRCHATGLSFKLNYKGKSIPVRLNNVIAKHFIYATLASLAVADVLGINIVEAIAQISNFQSSPGRMRLLEGKNATTIIDDTYNASPKSMKAALDTLAIAPAKRKIAVIGDMRELGKVSKKEHLLVAKQIKQMNLNKVFLIGDEVENIYNELLNVKVNVEYFKNNTNVGNAVLSYVKPGDVILVKASRGIGLEKIVKTLVTDTSHTL